ncbi:MAG: hypothetical protein GY797_38975 [Deltaproteobacteria bacterium]|nr:hypothetical protein [Deltaproteobacteria bacterium]
MPKPEWKDANDPPSTNEGCWSNEVVTVSNYGRVQSISYYGSKEDGCWQRPAIMLQSEQIEKWIEKPKGY